MRSRLPAIMPSLKYLQRCLLYEAKKYIYSRKKRENISSPMRIDDTRASYEKLFHELFAPLTPYFSKGKARIYIPNSLTSVHGKESDSYEAFARSFIGVACFLHHTKKGSYEEIVNLYKEGIKNGTDPNHPEYWGNIQTDQVLVENAAIALGLLLTKKHILNTFSQKEKQQLIDWFQSGAKRKFCHNNWLWFQIFHYLLLEQLEKKSYKKEILPILSKLDAMYEGDGWYRDSKEDFFDYYNAWGMHYYGLMFCYLASNEYEDVKRILKGRAQKFFQTYRYFFSSNNAPIYYGRSLTYRFGSLAPWGLGVLLDCCDVEMGEVRDILKNTLNAFLEKPIFRKDGVLTLGYFEENTSMLERYSGFGSPYWAMKAMSILLIPEDHEFWNQSSSVKKSQEKSQSIPSIKKMIHQTDSDFLLLLNAENTKKSYKNSYGKFVYSNTYNPQGLFDNDMQVKSGLLKSFCSQKEILSSECAHNVLKFSWRPKGVKDGHIYTRLIPQRNGYVAIHNVDIPYYEIQVGGFALSVLHDSFHIRKTENDVYIESGDSFTHIKNLFGTGRMSYFEKNDSVKTIYPYMRTKKGNNLLMYSCETGVLNV